MEEDITCITNSVQLSRIGEIESKINPEVLIFTDLGEIHQIVGGIHKIGVFCDSGVLPGTQNGENAK